jgi:O-antigen ligase
MLSEEMQEMVQGQGIIDIVNTYIAVALGSGVVGLSLFCGFFLSAAVGVLRAMRGVPDTKSDAYLLGRVLIATLIGILVMIFTVSSVTIIPTIYWAMAGLCVGYVRLVIDDVQVQGTGSSVTALRTKPLAR